MQVGDTIETGHETPPSYAGDPWSAENLENPYPMYETLREMGGVVWLEKYGMYGAVQHEECKTVLSDYERFMTSAGITMYDIRKPGQFRIPSRLLEVDPPEHTAVRRVAMRVMSPIVIRKMKGLFEEKAAEFAAKLKAKGEFDGVKELAEPYIIEAFPAAVGVRLVPEKALAIAEMRFNQSGPHNEFYHESMVKAEPFLEWFDNACERENVEPNSIASMLFDAEEAGELEEGVASNIVRSFVGGGVDSTISALGHTLHQLARHPDQFHETTRDPRKLRVSVEESIRLDSPFQYTWRTVREDCELSGYSLKKDTKITAFMGAANRDPRRWESPEKFDLSRDVVGNYLGFGAGDHNCIGQMIARNEIEAILTALLSAAESLTLTGEPTIRPVNQTRTLNTLPLRIK